MSNIATYLPSCASITSVVTSPSGNTFGESTIYHYLKCLLWLLPLSHFLPFIVPYHFSFIIFMVSKAFDLSSEVSISTLIGAITLFLGMAPLSNCFSYLIMAATAGSPNVLKHFVACICVNMTFTVVCR